MSDSTGVVSFEEQQKEIKKLRKKLSQIKERDMRGIQTLFRTTSHNHYTLNEMVDRKANIMITVNSIILSVLIGGLLSYEQTQLVLFAIAIMALTALFSIIFAIFSITPNKTQGKFSRDDILKKDGNLLYFGNFYDMEFEDYEWGMLQKLNDNDFLYRSMIKDLYYLGKVLNRKYKFIRLSLYTFLGGLIGAFFMTLLSFLISA
mgnify:CR=1 FL=1